MLKRFLLVVAILVMAFSLVGTAFASDGDPGESDVSTEESGGMGGVVLPHGKQPLVSPFAVTNLSYHGGPVMHTNKVYAIYWKPAGYTFASGYANHINQFFKDVAAASGQTSNVYYSSTQYYDNVNGYIRYKSVFGGYYVDTNPFPASGCALYGGLSACLKDSQLRTEIKRVINLKGWVPKSNTMFFIFTPDNVGSCFGSSCAFTDFCAYHSYENKIIYANQPYTYTKPNACGIQYATSSPPNGFAADSTINVVSHEHNEAITDPKLSAWWDSTTGYENGDKCAWIFGKVTSGHNQKIHGHFYILQKEWSNLSKGCVLQGY